jgi:hypothetical protein
MKQLDHDLLAMLHPFQPDTDTAESENENTSPNPRHGILTPVDCYFRELATQFGD